MGQVPHCSIAYLRGVVQQKVARGCKPIFAYRSFGGVRLTCATR